ncbi:hypothetical protein PV325_009764 [Microctonus aethiopoides]|nr:hypothetical protein PV325_009764 [Microctonus aethiopoides]
MKKTIHRVHGKASVSEQYKSETNEVRDRSNLDASSGHDCLTITAITRSFTDDVEDTMISKREMRAKNEVTIRVKLQGKQDKCVDQMRNNHQSAAGSSTAMSASTRPTKTRQMRSVKINCLHDKSQLL